MQPLTESDIRASLVNATTGDAARMTLPGLHETVWEDREYLGWRDPRAMQRGYIVHWRGDLPVGIALRAAESRMSRGISAMCSLCRTPQPADQVSLFTAPRAGEAGRNGNTVGTYICADLACSILIRIAPPASDMHPAPEEIIASRAAGLTARLDAFVGQVLATS
jgi:FBP C-terminal treble-clef zinc-finger